MKIKQLLYLAALGCLITGAVSCTSKRTIATYNTYKTECLGVEMDGSQTLKAWGNGRNRFDAVAQAKKTAVRDVLFTGIREGKPDCEVKPVLMEVNVLKKNEAYFNRFFADKGEFLNYVSLRDEKISHRIRRDKQLGNESVNRSVIVRVDRSGLMEKMKQDGILK